MIYGYARVSTLAQCKNGNSLEEQTEALTDYGCDKIITETFTGKTTERPQFNELLQLLLPGDTLVVTKLDRFARTVKNEDTYGNEIYEAYTSFCHEHGERALPMSSVIPMVASKAGITKKRSKKGNVYPGMRIKDEFERAG